MKVLSGVLIRGDGRRIKRMGEVEFAQVEFRADDGTLFTWKDLTMSREVAEVLWLNVPTKLYMSPRLGYVFGARTSEGEEAFKSLYSSPLCLVMSIGMIGAGLGTSTFLFPLLIALGGMMGIVMYLQASSAKRRYRRDGKKLLTATHG